MITITLNGEGTRIFGHMLDAEAYLKRQLGNGYSFACTHHQEAPFEERGQVRVCRAGVEHVVGTITLDDQ
jgi:hypothetical protein